MKRLLLLMAAFIGICASAHAENLNADNLSHGLTDTGDAALATGRLRFGVFRTLSNAQVQTLAAANDINALNADFIEVTGFSGSLNDGATGFFAKTNPPLGYTGGSNTFNGLPYDASPGSTSNAGGDIAGRPIVLWVLNNATLSAVTQHAIIESTKTWVDSDEIGVTESTFDTVGSTVVVGGTGSNIGGTSPSQQLVAITFVASAEIAVEQGSSLVDGALTAVDFGVVNPTGANTSVRVFTIRNVGTANLTITPPITKSGANQAEFTVGAPGATLLAPEASTTFTVTFDPTAGGTRVAAISIDSDDADEDPFDINFEGTGSGTFPEIQVEQPAATILTDNASTIDFGTTPADISVSKVFTIKNVGTSPLTSIVASITGPDAGAYTIAVHPAASVNGAASTTLTVQFLPGTVGTFNDATLSITSNDGNESPFDITLNGTGTAPVGSILFGQASVVVNEPGVPTVVNIPVIRTGGTAGAVGATVVSVNGTATAAAGDFVAIPGGTTVNFADGDATPQNVAVTINNDAVVEVNETFTVTLSAPTGGASLGGITTVPVTIVDPSSLSLATDTIRPVAPSIISPAANALVGVNSGDTMSITGTATDNKGVSKVQVSLNGSPFVDSVLGTPGAPTTTWSRTVTPVTGTNTVSVRTVEFVTVPTTVTVNNSSMASPTVVVDTVPPGLVVGAQLLGQNVTAIVGTTITLAGNANQNIAAPTVVNFTMRVTVNTASVNSPTVTAATPLPAALLKGSTLLGRTVIAISGGTLTLDGNASSNIAAPTATTFTTTQSFSDTVTRTFRVSRQLLVNIVGSGTVTAGFAPSSFREVGKSITITGTPTATPAPGNIFTGWQVSGGPTLAQLGITASALEKQTLTLIFREGLVLTANFEPNPFTALAGTYNGLVNTVTANADVSANSTEGFFKATVMNTGAFTGQLTVDGLVLGVNGALDHNGVARFGTSRATSIVVARTGKPSLKVELNMVDVDNPPFKIVGTVTQTAFKKSDIVATSSVAADRSHYNGTTLIPTNYVGPGPGFVTGTFTVILPARQPFYSVTGTFDTPNDFFDPGSSNDFQNGDAVKFRDSSGNLPPELNEVDTYTVINKTGDAFQVQDNTLTLVTFAGPGDGEVILDPDNRQTEGFLPGDYPQGYGFGTATVTKAGVVSFVGTLADGTPITASSTLSQNDEAALYAQLYSKLGFFSGLAVFNSSDPETDLSADGVKWMRPFIGTSHYFPYGWPEVLRGELLGARYDATGSVVKRADNSVLPADPDFIGDELAAPNLDTGNAQLTFGAGQLEDTLNKLVSISGTNVVTKVPDNDPTFSLVITGATGAFTGTLTHTDDTVPAFKGIIFQKGSMAGGYGHFLTKQPVPITYTGESGFVELIGF